MRLDSIKDDRVIEARALQTGHGRQAAGQCLLLGEEQIRWALARGCRVLHLFVHDKQAAPFKDIPTYFVTDGILKKITDTSYLIPVVGVAETPAARPPGDLLVVFDGVKEFGHIGTVVRTAFAFGIRTFASTEELDLFSSKTIDASRGTVFDASLSCYPGPAATLAALKQQGYQIAVTTTHQSELQSLAEIQKGPIALVFGNESRGVSETLLAAADLRIQIPMSGEVESLHVGVEDGISLYEMKLKWVLKMLTDKIHASQGRPLQIASRWMRLIFDAKLRELTPFNADQAIAMMILQREKTGKRATLVRDSGALSIDWDGLLAGRWIAESNGSVSLTEKGEEALAKIWPLHEWVERAAFEGVSAEEQTAFAHILEKIFRNCEKIVPYQ